MAKATQSPLADKFVPAPHRFTRSLSATEWLDILACPREVSTFPPENMVLVVDQGTLQIRSGKVLGREADLRKMDDPKARLELGILKLHIDLIFGAPLFAPKSPPPDAKP